MSKFYGFKLADVIAFTLVGMIGFVTSVATAANTTIND